MVVTKCPPDLSAIQQQHAIARLKPLNYQQVLFTSINYRPLQHLNGQPAKKVLSSGDTVFLLTGIANAVPLLQYLKDIGVEVVHHKYPDHHQFSLKNIAKLASDVNNSRASAKMVITTEKDARRLETPELLPHITALSIYVLPIGVSFLNDAGPQFDQIIENYVRQY
jgi:tetraacyldisaccharide 4'-kinase